MTHAAPEAFAACVGLDWAEAQHAVCLQTADSTKRACFPLEHTPEAIDAWVTAPTHAVPRPTRGPWSRTHQRPPGLRLAPG